MLLTAYMFRHVTFPDFSGIQDFQSSYILLEINRSQSQLSVDFEFENRTKLIASKI